MARSEDDSESYSPPPVQAPNPTSKPALKAHRNGHIEGHDLTPDNGVEEDPPEPNVDQRDLSPGGKATTDDVIACLQDHLEQTQFEMKHCLKMVDDMGKRHKAELTKTNRDNTLVDKRVEALQSLRGLRTSNEGLKKAGQSARDNATRFQTQLESTNAALTEANDEREKAETLLEPYKSRITALTKLGKRLDDGVIKRAARISELRKKQEIANLDSGGMSSNKGFKSVDKDIADQVHLLAHAWRSIESEYKSVTQDGDFEFDDPA
ncbi:MAG: hypothetical protein M1828_005084 [Chrysothrix sp. TS-e1954]|nr:MAG: hypothetical protein M1828_005084 [Chrysothrix sp. TS-e1954]